MGAGAALAVHKRRERPPRPRDDASPEPRVDRVLNSSAPAPAAACRREHRRLSRLLSGESDSGYRNLAEYHRRARKRASGLREPPNPRSLPSLFVVDLVAESPPDERKRFEDSGRWLDG